MSETRVDLGCFGCLLEVIGILGLVFIVAHWDAVWAFVTGALR